MNNMSENNINENDVNQNGVDITQINQQNGDTQNSGAVQNADMMQNNNIQMNNSNMGAGFNNNFGQTGKKRSFKLATIAVIVAAVVVILTCASFVFGSSTKTVCDAMERSFEKYFDSDSSEKTFLSQIFNNRNSDFFAEKTKSNIVANIKINEIEGLSYIEGAGMNFDINVDSEKKEVGAAVDGSFGRIDLPGIEAYYNDEYFAFKLPAIEPDKSFYFDIETFLKQVGYSENMLKSFAFQDLGKNDISFDNLSKEILREFTSSVKMTSYGTENIEGYDCDTYKCSLNKEETKDFIKRIFHIVIENEDFKNYIETLEKFVQSSQEGYDYDEFIKNIDEFIDNKMNIDNIDIAAYVDNKELIKLEVDIYSKGDLVKLKTSFTGKDEPIDNAEISLGYYYKSQKCMGEIVFADKTEKTDNIVETSKTLSSKDNDKEYLLFEFKDSYNSSTNEFKGSIDIGDDIFNGSKSKDFIGKIDFNGKILSDRNFNIDFESIKFKNVKDSIIADLSFSLKIDDFKEIKHIDKNGSVDILKNPEQLYDVFKNFAALANMV